MWKKPESDYLENTTPSPSSVPRQPVSEQAVIGSSLIVKGDLMGENDLLIQGQVEGKVVLKKNSVTVGKNGRVKADVYGKVITVDGKVQGNLFGDERIVINQSGDVRGNLTAPRVTLEDGARFKGSIDMEAKTAEKANSSSPLITPGSSAGVEAQTKGEEKKEETGKPGIKLS